MKFIEGSDDYRKMLDEIVKTNEAPPPDVANTMLEASLVVPKVSRAKRMEIGGKEFWRAESEEKSQAGKMHKVIYTSVMNGYTSQFMVFAFDAKLGAELLQSIESISFFDPAQAKALA